VEIEEIVLKDNDENIKGPKLKFKENNSFSKKVS